MKNLTTEARRLGEESGDRMNVAGLAIDETANMCIESVIGYTACICHPERVGADATASRRTPTTPVPEYAVSGSSHEATDITTEARGRPGNSYRDSVFSDHTITRSRTTPRSPSVPAVVKKMILVVRATLREIFDESAYDRFLLRNHASRSTASYRAFMRERDAAIVKKPRCC